MLRSPRGERRADRHIDVPHDPSFNEADISDKPAFRQLPPFSAADAAAIDDLYRSAAEMVVALDSSIASLIDHLDALNVLDDTLVLLTSDNGVYFGEHRIPSGKFQPFEAGIRVPLVVSGPGFPAGAVETRPVANVDLAPTIVHAAGASPGLTMDGVALQSLVADPGLLVDRPVLIESGPLWSRRYYHGVRVDGFKYLEYSTGEVELYDLDTDPFELANRAGDPSLATVQAQLRNTMLSMRACSGATCLDPPPPSGTAPPIADAGGDKTVAPGQVIYLVALNSFDPDGGPLSYHWEALAGTAPGILNPNSAVGLAGAPTTFQTLHYRVTVTDQTGLSASDDATITIGYPYHAPIIDAGPNRTVRSSSIVYLVGTAASDSYPLSSLTFQWSQTGGAPIGILNANRPTAVLRAPPGPATLQFQVVVGDPTYRTGSDLLTIKVNGPPVANAGPDKTVPTGSIFWLVGTSSSDPDKDKLTYSWWQIAGSTTGIVGSTKVSGAAKAPSSAAELTYRLKVTDQWGDSSTDDVVITVSP